MSKYLPLWEYIRQCPGEKLTLSYAEIEKITGLPVDHAFLSFKKELPAFGWQFAKVSMKKQEISFARLPEQGESQ